MVTRPKRIPLGERDGRVDYEVASIAVKTAGVAFFARAGGGANLSCRCVIAPSRRSALPSRRTSAAAARPTERYGSSVAILTARWAVPACRDARVEVQTFRAASSAVLGCDSFTDLTHLVAAGDGAWAITRASGAIETWSAP